MADVSKSLNTLTYIIILAALVIAISPFVFFWMPKDVAFVSHQLLDAYGGVEQLSSWQKLLGFIVTALPAMFLLWSLHYLFRLVRALQAGLWFEESSEILCRRFGRTLIWYVIVQILHRTLLVLVLTSTNPPGERELHISFSNNDVMTLLPAILAMIFAHIVSLGRSQQDELKQIV